MPKENQKESNFKEITMLERIMIATETDKTALLRKVNEISPHTIKKWQLERILAGENEILSLFQIKIIAIALGIDYTDLISGAAGYSGMKVKQIDQNQQIKNNIIRRKRK